MNQNDKKEEQRKNRVLMILIILIILILLTLFVVFGRLNGFSSKDNSIPLVPTDEENDIMVPVWKTETDFSLFDSFYDEKGSVTVNSLNGDNVIAPGTSKCYNFSLKNNSNVILDYNIKFDTTLKINDDEKDLTDFPILVRIKNDNEYFLGNDNLWVPIIELDNYTKSGVLDVGNYAYYLLEWKWNFEDNNIKDTILGKDATMNDIVLDITVFTESKLSKDFSSKVLSSDKAIPAFNEVSNDESDGKKCWSWWWLIVILILLLLGLIIRNILINQEGDVDEK